MLNKLLPARGSKKNRKRVGRGPGAGGGKTCGRGTKGQQARAGYSRKFGFEGGQTPVLQRQPKLGGFRNPCRNEYEVLNLCDLNKAAPGSYGKEELKSLGLLRTAKPFKLLGRGEAKGRYELKVDAVSKSAKEAVEKAGGSVMVDN